METTNYRTVRLPADLEVPVFVKDDLADFYRDMFARQVDKDDMRTVFLEYAWDMGWCDPCAADPLSDRELSELGVFWVGDRPQREIKRQARDVFVTRLHLRYTADTFPEDLFFQETGDRTNFQGRYIIRHPWRGSPVLVIEREGLACVQIAPLCRVSEPVRETGQPHGAMSGFVGGNHPAILL